MAPQSNIFSSVREKQSGVPKAALTFYDVVEGEVAVIHARRIAWAERRGETDMGPWGIQVSKLEDEGKTLQDDQDQSVPEVKSGRALVGLALSGGGVRSAAFGLGVLQGLDAVLEGEAPPQVLHAVDYLSTVSGGGYIGASMMAGLLTTGGTFPFASKRDGWETDGTQHLRDHSNYLLPHGPMDGVVGAVVLLRGLLINALLVFGLVFLACAVTALFNPDETRTGLSWVPVFGLIRWPFAWTTAALSLFVAVQLPPIAAFAGRIGLLPLGAVTLEERERIGTRLAVLLLLCGGVFLFELQSFVLRGMFDASHLTPCRMAVDQAQACLDAGKQAGWLGHALYRAGLGAGAPWLSVMAGLGALGAFGEKLVRVAGATFGDRSWTGLAKHWGSRLAVAVGAAVVPLAIWIIYLSLCFAAIRCVEWPYAPACCDPTHPPNLPNWLWWIGQDHMPLAYMGVGALFLLGCFAIPTNANSLHGYYRDRLSRAFLGHPADLAASGKGAEDGSKEASAMVFDPDRLKLSRMVPRPTTAAEPWSPTAEAAPYLLLNAAVNLEASPYTNRRGRNADSFTLGALHCGSSATGYAATSLLEKADPSLNLATAMAISGAAASANMGASTIRLLTFSLAALNVRLGYWLPNPRQLARDGAPPRGWQTLWPAAFSLEALGLLDERRPLVYLTDGGHFDNLGIYELLKRRCRVIIASDAEADPPMNFESLVRLERCARIDLGIRIDLPWEDLRRWSRGVTVDAPHGPDDDPSACIGPHVALGRIEYGTGDPGLLIYIKACISGDENDLIRDYRRRHTDFPHETTLDQFFTEEQFEVYRALGFHATKSFFSGQDRFGFSPSHVDTNWTTLVRGALKRLAIPEGAIDRIVAQQMPKPASARRHP